MENKLVKPLFVFDTHLNFTAVDHLRVRLSALIDTCAENEIVFDMQHVTVCDSSGLRLLLTLHRKVNNLDKKMVLYKPKSPFIELLRIANLDHVFNISLT